MVEGKYNIFGAAVLNFDFLFNIHSSCVQFLFTGYLFAF